MPHKKNGGKHYHSKEMINTMKAQYHKLYDNKKKYKN